MLNRQQVLGLYLLWVLILFIELLYFFGVKDSSVEITFAVVVIAVTVAIGAVGINVFKK